MAATALLTQNISPGTEIFDNRTYFAAQLQTVTYQKSARTAFVFGGNAFTTRRKAVCSLELMVTERREASYTNSAAGASIGATYDYLKYEYPGQYGNATAHQLMLTYRAQISHRWSLDLGGGAFHAEVEGLTNVRCRPRHSSTFRH